MMWVMIVVALIIIVGGILGGMGFFGQSSSPDRRGSTGNNFIDWLL